MPFAFFTYLLWYGLNSSSKASYCFKINSKKIRKMELKLSRVPTTVYINESVLLPLELGHNIVL